MTLEERFAAHARDWGVTKWAFATTVLGILWPVEAGIGIDLRTPFASAARSMLALLGGS